MDLHPKMQWVMHNPNVGCMYPVLLHRCLLTRALCLVNTLFIRPYCAPLFKCGHDWFISIIVWQFWMKLLYFRHYSAGVLKRRCMWGNTPLGVCTASLSTECYHDAFHVNNWRMCCSICEQLIVRLSLNCLIPSFCWGVCTFHQKVTGLGSSI